jgi:hypothetical protein
VVDEVMFQGVERPWELIFYNLRIEKATDELVTF